MICRGVYCLVLFAAKVCKLRYELCGAIFACRNQFYNKRIG